LAGTTFLFAQVKTALSDDLGRRMSDTEVALCSAKGCTEPAEWALLWRNPRIHGRERRKVWLACAEHRESLGEFLGSRGFLIEVVEHQDGVDLSA
jgi:uncharacterized lipoprotein YmbA